MANGDTVRFCLLTCLLKRLAKYLLELWLCIVEYYLGKYRKLCGFLEFWPRLLWLTTRTRGYKPARYGGGDSTNGGLYIDLLLNKMMSDWNVSDLKVIHNYKDSFVNRRVEIGAFSYITGLKTLHRTQPASLIEENGQLKLKAELGAGMLYFFYSGRLQFWNVVLSFASRLNIGYLAFHIEFSVDSETGRNGRLNELVIYDMRGVNFRINTMDFKPFDYVLNKFINGVMKIFRRFFQNLIEVEIENYIVESIRNFQFPLRLELETPDGVLGTSEVEPTENMGDPITTEDSNEKVADAAERDSEGKSETTVEETAAATNTPEFHTAGEVVGEQITAATEHDFTEKTERTVEEATDTPEIDTAVEVNGEQLADATERESKEKSETTIKKTAEASDTQELNTSAKEMIGADDAASVETTELETSEGTLSVPTSSSESETTYDVSDLD